MISMDLTVENSMAPGEPGDDFHPHLCIIFRQLAEAQWYPEEVADQGRGFITFGMVRADSVDEARTATESYIKRGGDV